MKRKEYSPDVDGEFTNSELTPQKSVKKATLAPFYSTEISTHRLKMELFNQLKLLSEDIQLHLLLSVQSIGVVTLYYALCNYELTIPPVEVYVQGSRLDVLAKLINKLTDHQIHQIRQRLPKIDFYESNETNNEMVL